MMARRREPGVDPAGRRRVPAAPSETPGDAVHRSASRRRFLKLLAAGSAAVATVGVPVPPGAATRSKPRQASVPLPPKVRAEIANQKRYVAKALETIRAFSLPPGSDPAFVFVALEPKRTRVGSDRDPGRSSPR